MPLPAALEKRSSGHADYIPHTLKIEIETETLAQVDEALASGADIIMLDNMSLADMRSAVVAIAGRALVEASGGVNSGDGSRHRRNRRRYHFRRRPDPFGACHGHLDAF